MHTTLRQMNSCPHQSPEESPPSLYSARPCAAFPLRISYRQTVALADTSVAVAVVGAVAGIVAGIAVADTQAAVVAA